MKYFLLPLVSLLIIVSLQSCGENTGETKTEADKKLQPVKVREIVTETFKETYKIVGIVKPYQSAKVSSEEGGLITYQPFDKGNRVSRGQVVVRLRKDQDAAAYEQAITQFELAQSNYDRVEKLYKENVATEQDYTNAKFQLELSERSLDVLETRLDKSYVVSPISGVVEHRYLVKGEVCGPGTPILDIVDVSRVKVTGGMPERFINDVKKGTEVRITFDVYPGEEFFGKINYVSPVISPTNRTFDIEIVLNNPDGRYKPEMSANIEIEKTNIENAVILPQDLIVDYGSEKYVFVLEGDVAKKRSITQGGRNGNNVHVLSGVNPGEKLIIEGFLSVADGDKVMVIE